MTSTSNTTPDLRAAAQAVIDRWDTPLWKDAPATAGYIAALRDALAAEQTELETLHADVEHKDKCIKQLGRELAAECRLSANEKLRANQLALQHGMQSKMRSEDGETILALKSENAALQQGYAAARLEIESLRKEHADELAVAYMCGASREKELAAQQPGAAYAAPQFPAHPEPMVMDWSAIEISVIAQYGRDMYEAGKRQSHGRPYPTIDDLCARIKAADDAAADRDYMLDSNDCIAVLRGQWKGPMAMDKPERAPHGQAPASTFGDFIRRTNEDYAAWCATQYTPEFNSKGPDLHGLWAWQEQQRRMDDLLRQAPINLPCKSEQKRLATLWGFVPAQPAPNEDEGISREQWIEQAMRVYLIAGDTEQQAEECAKYLWGELDLDDLADPYDAAMSDVEERGPAPQPSPAAQGDALSQAARDVLAEVERATRKFPTWPTDPLHALAVLGEEFGELTKDMLQLTYEPHKTNAANVRTEALQTAAMALRLFMSLDRYEYRPGAQHSQDAARAAQEGK